MNVNCPSAPLRTGRAYFGVPSLRVAYLVAILGALAPATALAHSVGLVSGTTVLDAETRAMLLRRAAEGDPGVRVGDELAFVISFYPMMDSAEVGAGGYLTAYIPPGTEVIGADIVSRGPDGVWVPVPPQLPGPISEGWGERGEPRFRAPFDVHRQPACATFGRDADRCGGSLAMLYADTGVFYSTSPSTALITGSDAVALQGRNGLNVDPTGASALNSMLGQSVATTHNAWDAAQTNAFGSSSGDVEDLPAPASAQPSLSDGQGVTPFGAGSPVAGPDTGYPLDAAGPVGPWQRVAYFGSRQGTLAAGPATSRDGSGGLLGIRTAVLGSFTGAGRVLSPTAPLPRETNAVRFAVGRIVAGTPVVARVRLRVIEPPPASGIHLVAEVFGGDSAEAAGQAGKDNPWRYHVPSVSVGSTELFLEKTLVSVDGRPVDGSVPTAGVFRYRIAYANLGSRALTGVRISDLLPSDVDLWLGARVVSGPNLLPTTPATPTSERSFSFAPVSLAPGAGGVLEYDIRCSPSSDDPLSNVATARANESVATITSRVYHYALAAPVLRVGLSADDAMAGASSLTRFRASVTNVGSGDARSVVLEVILPGTSDPMLRFEFEHGSDVVTGTAPVVPSVSLATGVGAGTGRIAATWRFTGARLAPGQTWSVVFDARAPAAWVPRCTEGIAEAAVWYSGAPIEMVAWADTVAPFSSVRDFDGDGISNEEECSLGLDPTAADSDGGGVPDGVERSLYGTDPGDSSDDFGFDFDGDGLANEREAALGTDPRSPDSDGDGCSDGFEEVDASPPSDPRNPDSDGGGRWDCDERADGTDPSDPADDIGHDLDRDGLTNERETALGTDPRNPDTDGDGCGDGTEVHARPRATNPLVADSDGGGANDCEERAAGTDPWVPYDDVGHDFDGDGLPNHREAIYDADPRIADTDGGGALDGAEVAANTDPTDPADDIGFDFDGDGLPNEAERLWRTDPRNPDTDGDECFDGTEVHGDPPSDPLVFDTDGGGNDDCVERRDGTDPSSPSDDVGHDWDGDGIPNEIELAIGTDPANPDTDGDGRSDGDEYYGPIFSDPLNPDSDGGGADDGHEVEVDGTDPMAPSDDIGFDFDEDGFLNETEFEFGTDPAAADTDGDGLCDGAIAVPSVCVAGEDLDTDGRVGASETDPRNPDTDGGGTMDGEEVVTTLTDPRYPGDDDRDGDGLDNDTEAELGTDEADADTDDDGLLDGEEVDLQTDPFDADTDGDRILDGTEVGVTAPHAHTDLEVFRPDLDPDTVTDPLGRDTDGGGLGDGSEDANSNGRVDPGETDPLDASDDSAGACVAPDDCDGDGLTDALELEIGTLLLDPDTDGDSLSDGLEHHGATGTSPLLADTDGDGLCDGPTGVIARCLGGEDLDRDGVVGPGETDPTRYDTDEGGVGDGDERLARTDPLDPSDDMPARKADSGCCATATGGDRRGGPTLALVILLGLLRVRRRATLRLSPDRARVPGDAGPQ